MKKNHRLTRRQLMQNAGLTGSIAADLMLGGPFLGLLPRSLAAIDPNEWTQVTIKVCNQVHMPLVFARGTIQSGNKVLLDASIPTPLGSITRTAVGNYLKQKGVNNIHPDARMKFLRFNEWFGEMFLKGTHDGLSASERSLIAPHTQVLSNDRVAIQNFLNLGQILPNTHSLKATKLRSDLPDLSYFLAEQNLVIPPMGIVAFMMGGQYDKAEGSLPFNAVLGAAPAETPLIPSRTVTEYVSLLSQFLQPKGYIEKSLASDNLIFKFDRLVSSGSAPSSSVREEMFRHVEAFRSNLPKLQQAANLEKILQTRNDELNNLQSLTDQQTSQGAPASLEFLSQCVFVKQALEIPGLPLRSFSLFLNIVDLDGNNLDSTFNTVSGANVEGSSVKAYTYLEGMRQLAVGLNILAKSIASGKKLIVNVVSEGGRDANMRDSRTSFNIVLGPKGPGLLDDYVYANLKELARPNSGVFDDPAQPGAAVAWDTDFGIRTAAGSKDTNAIPNTGDVQMGIVQFLEEKTGRVARSHLSADQGRYVYLKRK